MVLLWIPGGGAMNINDATADSAEFTALAPLNIIRTETVLSKLPVHNLAKKGKVDIRIVRRSQAGEVLLKWEVSYSDRYGQPRQLAYKVDTLIVNRRLDEESRPLPTLIRIGSLKDICKQLGLQESGKNTRDLRTALLQNASAFINARLAYRGTDGVERSLEAGFARYGVVFTGEKLPNGHEADAVYITLNQPYWEVVNSAPVRPLDYDYLKALTPAAQRFYEIISFRIYAALKNSRPQARIAYSDYCTFSAQQRYFDHEHFRVQMYKIHKPHLASGYLKAISIEPAVDGEGNPDWTLIYTPGPKAKAEFGAFAKKQGEPQVQTVAEPTPTVDSSQNALLRALVSRGISEPRARTLVSELRSGQQVTDQLEWADHLLSLAPSGTFRNPPGFYVSIIRDNIGVPDHFETSRKRQQWEEVERARNDSEILRRELETAYDQYLSAEVDNACAKLPAAQMALRVASRRKTYAKQFPNLFPTTLDELAAAAVRREIQDEVRLMSFDEFKNHSAHKGHKGPNVPKGRTAQLFEIEPSKPPVASLEPQE
jgi:hypothetical protein